MCIRDRVVNAENGLLVAPDDHVALAQALEQLLQNPAYGETLSKHARETIEEQFNLETIAADLESLFHKSVSRQNETGGQA